MPARVNVLKTSMAPLVKMMSGLGLTVKFEGDSATTQYNAKTGKPEEIILPVINDDVDSEKCRVFHGYLDHEVGHVLFTDISGIVSALTENNNGVKFIFNALEDARIETQICAKYKGSASNLLHMHSFTFDDAYVSSISADTNSIDHKLKGLILSCRAIAGQDYFKNKIRSTSLNDVYDKIFPILKDVDFLKINSTECFSLAQRVADVLDFKTSTQAKTQKKNSKGKSDDKDKSDDKGKGQQLTNKQITRECRAIENATQKQISRLAEQLSNSSEYVIETTDNDEIQHAQETENNSLLSLIDQSARTMIGALQKNLERAIATRSISRWTPGFKSGKLNSSSLVNLRFANARVFKRRSECETKNAAVTLLIDCSGSMHGRKIRTAVFSAYALAQTLSRIGVSCEVMGFTTRGFHGVSSIKVCARYVPLYLPIVKSFSDSWNIHAKRRLAGFMDGKSCQLNQNVDGESVAIAAERLLQRPENNKILLVLSDGAPWADGDNAMLMSHLHKVIEYYERRIKIVGIGIETDQVAEFYKKNVSVFDLEELPKSVIKELRSAMLS